MFDASGFSPGKRAAFILPAQPSAEFDFTLDLCSHASGLKKDDQEHWVAGSWCEGDFQYEELVISTNSGLRPLVSYGERKAQNDSILYSGSLLVGVVERNGKLEEMYTARPAVLTFDLTTIKAKSLIYSPNQKAIKGTGDVVWQEGNETRHGNEIEMSFLNGELSVRMAR